jgi:diguanylate cyclase (GGDEF)-like protein
VVQENLSPRTRAERLDADQNRVLYVEDDANLRLSFARSLMLRGVGVDTASCRSEALELLGRHSYPVIVTDLLLPEIDGVTLVHELRGVQPDASFIITTGCDVEYRAPGGLEDSIACFLKKPWNDRELASAVDSARESYRIRCSTRAPAYEPQYSVLLVERDAQSSELKSLQLEQCGLCDNVAYCAHLERAITLLRGQSFDALIVDVAEADAAGLATFERLRAAAPQSALIVFGESEAAISGALLETQEFLVKGQTDADALRRSLRQAIEHKRQEQRIAYLAHHDSLTQLTNRTTFCQKLEQSIASSVRAGRRCAVMFIDLDGFGQVNDMHGNEAGDTVLCEVARRIQASVREEDTVARLGGDEFAVLVEVLEDVQIGARVAQRILQIIGMPVLVRDDLEITLRASVGIAVCPESAQTADALLLAADAAMHAAKAAGGGHHLHDIADDAPLESEQQAL